jgi:DNA-binding IclR family transcriptional regulator
MKNENVPALQRAHDIMRYLLASPKPVGISELARRLSMSKSTVHGLVHTLDNLGLLENVGDNGRGFRPAGDMLDLWRQALLSGAFRRAAAPYLADFSKNHDLTAMAGCYLAGRVLVVEAVVAPGLGLRAYAGLELPVWAGALGKVLLASLPPEQSKPMIPRLAARSPLSRPVYEEEVQAARRIGAAVDRDEYIPGVSALAAALPQAGLLAPVRAVWTVGLSPSLNQERMSELIPVVKRLAEDIHGAAA